jgi:hypothetical protein
MHTLLQLTFQNYSWMMSESEKMKGRKMKEPALLSTTGETELGACV